MVTIAEVVQNRLPDEAAIFAASLGAFIEEAQSDAGFEGVAENALSTRQKSLIADLAAKALILPAMSKYKKAVEEAEGDGAGKAKFADKLAFLKQMETKLVASITERKAALSIASDSGVPMTFIETE